MGRVGLLDGLAAQPHLDQAAGDVGADHVPDLLVALDANGLAHGEVALRHSEGAGLAARLLVDAGRGNGVRRRLPLRQSGRGVVVVRRAVGAEVSAEGGARHLFTVVVVFATAAAAAAPGRARGLGRNVHVGEGRPHPLPAVLRRGARILACRLAARRPPQLQLALVPQLRHGRDGHRAARARETDLHARVRLAAAAAEHLLQHLVAQGADRVGVHPDAPSRRHELARDHQHAQRRHPRAPLLWTSSWAAPPRPVKTKQMSQSAG